MFFLNRLMGLMVLKTVRCADVAKLVRLIPIEVSNLRVELVIMLFKHLVCARACPLPVCSVTQRHDYRRGRLTCAVLSTYCGPFLGLSGRL